MEKVPNTKRPDDITLRDILFKSWEYVILVLKFWWLVLILVALFAWKEYAKIAKVTPVYPAEVTFLVKTQEIAKENKNNILIYSRFANTQSTIEKILLEPVDTNLEDYVINHYLNAYFEFKPNGLGGEVPTGFQFLHNNRENFTPEEQTVFKSVVTKITTYVKGYADGFVNVSVDESLGLVTISTSTPSEELTLLLMDKLKSNFVEKLQGNSTFAQDKSYQKFLVTADSLEDSYRDIYYQLHTNRNKYQLMLNYIKDSTDSKIRYMHKKIVRLEVEADIHEKNWLSTIKIFKSIERDRYMSNPIIEILKETLPPLQVYIPNPNVAAIKGGITGGMIAVALVIFFSIIRSVIREGKEGD